VRTPRLGGRLPSPHLGPAEGRRFLREIPLFEESGVLVSAHDWWAGLLRPQVSVSIGSDALTFLDAASILDMKVGLALGRDSLSADELVEIRAIGGSLTLLKGPRVEIDSKRLDEALGHWKRVAKGSMPVSFPSRRESDTLKDAWASATIFSLVETARTNGHEPYHHLRHLFVSLPITKDESQAADLVP